MAEILFWGSAALMVYAIAGYPLAIGLLSAIRPRPLRKDSFTPEVTILVIARDEEESIGGKIENLLGQEYPPEKRKIVVASDASTDRTDAIVRSFEGRGVSLERMETRTGKPGILNRMVPAVGDEFVVLSDSRQRWSRDSLKRILANFADPEVGAACGELIIGQAEEGTFPEGVRAYWRYEKYLRKKEAAYDSTCGTTGAVYAIRRDLFEKLPEDTLLDDFVVPMNIVRQGFRVVFEEGAIAVDKPSDSASHEMARKIRTLAGNYQAFFRMHWLFLPWKNRLFFQFVSHKVLRLAVPFLMIAVFLANMSLLDRGMYVALFSAQAVFYLLALLSIRIRTPVLSMVKAFIVLNFVALMALPAYLSGRQKVTWK